MSGFIFNGAFTLDAVFPEADKILYILLLTLRLSDIILVTVIPIASTSLHTCNKLSYSSLLFKQFVKKYATGI